MEISLHRLCTLECLHNILGVQRNSRRRLVRNLCKCLPDVTGFRTFQNQQEEIENSQIEKEQIGEALKEQIENLDLTGSAASRSDGEINSIEDAIAETELLIRDYFGYTEQGNELISALYDKAEAFRDEKAMPRYAQRDDRLASMTDESVDTFYTCIMCQAFSPSHVCIVTPERLGLCGAVSWLDAKATNELRGKEEAKQFRIEEDRKAAKALAGRYGDIEKLFEASAEDIEKIEDFGQITAKCVEEFFENDGTRVLIAYDCNNPEDYFSGEFEQRFYIDPDCTTIKREYNLEGYAWLYVGAFNWTDDYEHFKAFDINGNSDKNAWYSHFFTQLWERGKSSFKAIIGK